MLLFSCTTGRSPFISQKSRCPLETNYTHVKRDLGPSYEFGRNHKRWIPCKFGLRLLFVIGAGKGAGTSAGIEGLGILAKSKPQSVNQKP